MLISIKRRRRQIYTVLTKELNVSNFEYANESECTEAADGSDLGGLQLEPAESSRGPKERHNLPTLFSFCASLYKQWCDEPVAGYKDLTLSEHKHLFFNFNFYPSHQPSPVFCLIWTKVIKGKQVSKNKQKNKTKSKNNYYYYCCYFSYFLTKHRLFEFENKLKKNTNLHIVDHPSISLIF